jgi:putative endonuclease
LVESWRAAPGRTSLAAMTLQTNAVGAYGERVAMRTLALAGFTILDHNWRCPEGELDLVARDERFIVFCEVKTRRSRWFGEPVDAVTAMRVLRIRGAATAWLAAHPRHRGEVRFDVICVWPQRTGPARVSHLVSAF